MSKYCMQIKNDLETPPLIFCYFEFIIAQFNSLQMELCQCSKDFFSGAVDCFGIDIQNVG